MPGGRLKPFRLGDRSELLVQHLLAGIAFTTPVPRQEDIGVDFLCSLITGYGAKNLLKAGPFFSVQAKSNTASLEYSEPHQIEWITSQENPLLICVADRDAGAMDIYSTWNLLCAVMSGWKGKAVPKCIRLLPGISHTGDWRGVEDQQDGSQDIFLGKPIIRITHQQIFDESKVMEIADILGYWIKLDRENIVNCRAGLNWVAGPISYSTGISPKENMAFSFYWNPQNLSKCSENLVRSAAAVWRICRDSNGAGTESWREGIELLRGLLRPALKYNPSLQPVLHDLET